MPPSNAAPDTLRLANATGEALVYQLAHPRMGSPLRQTFTVDTNASPSMLVAPDAEATLLPCSGLSEFTGGTLFLYRLSPLEDGKATAHLARSVELTEAYLSARRKDCLIEVERL